MQISIEPRDGIADCNPSVSEVTVDADYTIPTHWNPQCIQDRQCKGIAQHMVSILATNYTDRQDFSACDSHVSQVVLDLLYPQGS
jgi:hypothetical protein